MTRLNALRAREWASCFRTHSLDIPHDLGRSPPEIAQRTSGGRLNHARRLDGAFPPDCSQLAWWLALIGYNPLDHTLSQRIYLVYAGIFWSVWLWSYQLLAGPATVVLKALNVSPIDQAAAVLSILAMVGWGMYQLCRPLAAARLSSRKTTLI